MPTTKFLLLLTPPNRGGAAAPGSTTRTLPCSQTTHFTVLSLPPRYIYVRVCCSGPPNAASFNHRIKMHAGRAPYIHSNSGPRPLLPVPKIAVFLFRAHFPAMGFPRRASIFEGFSEKSCHPFAPPFSPLTSSSSFPRITPHKRGSIAIAITPTKTWLFRFCFSPRANPRP